MPQATEGPVVLTFRLPAHEHLDLKVTAARLGKPMGDIVREALDSHLPVLKKTLRETTLVSKG